LVGAISTPSLWTVVVVAAIVVPALLILDLGPWYLIGLLAIYAALDIAQRADMRRDARNRLAILAASGQDAPSVRFVGSARHCRRAAWLAKRLGWFVCPIERERMFRHSIRFRCVSGSSSLNMLLDALNGAKLATRIRLLDVVPSFGRRLSEQGLWEATDASPVPSDRRFPVSAAIDQKALPGDRLLFAWDTNDDERDESDVRRPVSRRSPAETDG
jgi:hypothetical protein